jgi:hypothetical protein
MTQMAQHVVVSVELPFCCSGGIAISLGGMT